MIQAPKVAPLWPHSQSLMVARTNALAFCLGKFGLALMTSLVMLACILWRKSIIRDPQQGSLTERGRLSTVDLLVLTISYQFLSILKILFTFLTNTKYRNEEVNCTETSPQLVFRGINYKGRKGGWGRLMNNWQLKNFYLDRVRGRIFSHVWPFYSWT